MGEPCRSIEPHAWRPPRSNNADFGRPRSALASADAIEGLEVVPGEPHCSTISTSPAHNVNHYSHPQSTPTVTTDSGSAQHELVGPDTGPREGSVSGCEKLTPTNGHAQSGRSTAGQQALSLNDDFLEGKQYRPEAPVPPDGDAQNLETQEAFGTAAKDPEKGTKEETTTEVEDPNIVDWDGPDDPENPVNWQSSRKWAIIAILASISFLT